MLSRTLNLSLRLVAIAVAASMLFIAGAAYSTKAIAGTTGSISGTAVDAASNSPIAGAKITVSGPSAQQSTTTDKGGRFSFASLPPDSYTVNLQASGYAGTSLSDVGVTADNEIDITLSATAVK
jgi:hypothetical protein